MRTRDGWVLQVERLRPEGPPRGVVLALHAMMADRRSLHRPGRPSLPAILVEAGWEVWLADFRGHGGSGPRFSEGGSWCYEDLVRRDVPDLAAAAKRAVQRPLVLLGHSLGGHVALASVVEGLVHPAAVVTLAANMWLPGLDAHPVRRAARHLAVAALRVAVRLRGGFEARALGIGSADEAGPYLRDLARCWQQDRWGPAAGGDWLAGLASVEVPVLALFGAGDRLLAHPVGGRAWIDGVPGVTVRVVGEGRRGAPGHMGLVTDPACVPSWREVARWLEAAVSPEANESRS